MFHYHFSFGSCSIIVRKTTGGFDFLSYAAPSWDNTALTAVFRVCLCSSAICLCGFKGRL